MLVTLTGPMHAYGASAGWALFTAKSGFKIRYPEAWTRIAVPDTNLLISSSQERLEAVIIPRGAQMIAVQEILPVRGDDYLSFIKNGNTGDQIIRHFTVDLRHNDGKHCDRTNVVEAADEVGPGTFYIEDYMYCKIGSRAFLLTLTQWRSDPFSEAAFRTSISMISSLHL
jgi:hypothetical protein